MHLQARDSNDRTVARTTTAGQIAEALISAEVTYEGVAPKNPETGRPCCNASTRGTVGTPAGVRITLWASGLGQTERGLGITIAHEGAHGTQANAELRRLADPRTFDQTHQFSFRRGATMLYDNYDDQ
jgi:hypothetical protein